MTDTGTETLSSDDRPERTPRERRRGRRRGLLALADSRLSALGAVTSLVLAGGVATAAYRSLQHAPDPATQIPASAFAVAVADLDAGGSIGAFADHFPGSPTRRGPGSTVDRLLRSMLKDSSSPHVDYDKDIGPWLGSRVAFAAWLDGKQPKVEVVLKSTDDTLARTRLGLLEATEGGFGWTVQGGWAVLSDNGDDAAAAVTAAQRAPLSGRRAYVGDIASLPAGEAAVGWIDGPAAQRALEAAAPGLSGSALLGDPFGALGLPGTGSVTALAGRLSAGLRFSGDHAELDLDVTGTHRVPTAPASMLTRLPSDTIGAIELAKPDAAVTAATKVLSEFAGASAVSVGCGSSGPVMGHAAVPRLAFAVPPRGTTHRRQIIRRLRRLRRHMLREQRRLRKQLPATPTTLCPMTQPTQPPDPLDAVARVTGLHLPADGTALLGDRAVISFGGLNIGALPDIAVRSHPAGLSAARAVADRMSSTVAAHSSVHLAVHDAGSDLVVGTSPAYAAKVAAGGDLGSQARFASALAGMPGDVIAAGYLDLSRLWPTVGIPSSSAIRHLKAVGFWGTTTAGGGAREEIRVLVG